MCIFTPWGILPRNRNRTHHHHRKSTTTPSTSSPTYAPRLVQIQPPKHYQSLNYPTPKSKPPSTHHHHLSSETQPLLSHSRNPHPSPPLRTRTSPPLLPPTYPDRQTRIRALTSQLLQRQTLETRRDVLATLADRYHDVPQQSSAASRAETKRRRSRRATISPPLSSVGSESGSDEGWSSAGGFDRGVRGRGNSFSTPGTSVSLWSGEGGGAGGGGGNGIGNGNGNGGGGLVGYGYNIPFVQAPQLPLFAAYGGAAASSESGSGGSEASTVSEYWTHGPMTYGAGGGGGGGGGYRYWNDSSPVGSRGERRARGGVVNSWGEGRRGGTWDRERGEGVGYATLGGLTEARERTERGIGRLEGEIGRARAGAAGYRLWSWE